MNFSNLLRWALIFQTVLSADYEADIDLSNPTSITMEEYYNTGARVYTVSFTVPSSESSSCENPSLSVTFEDTDFSPGTNNEFLKITYQAADIAVCQASGPGINGFGSCETEVCLNDYDLGTTAVLPSQSLDLIVEVGVWVDPYICYPLSGSVKPGLILNANVTVECNPVVSVGPCIGGDQHEITVDGSLYIDATQCGLGCISVASLQECNNACYNNAACVAYVYAPDQYYSCALFDSTNPIRRDANQIMCEDCALGVYAKSVGVNDMPAESKTVKDVFNINNIYYEYIIGLNAAVAGIVSLFTVCMVLTICYCCQNKGYKYDNQIKMTEEEEDV